VGVAFFPHETYHVTYPLSVSFEKKQDVDFHGIQKVVGSIPISSTSQPLAKQGVVLFLGNASHVATICRVNLSCHF
jgi:hypothetical protein